MKTNSHTPSFTAGTWRADADGYIIGERLVAKLCRHHFENDNQTAYPEVNRELRAEYEANARLIAAAPQLLAACQMALARAEAEEETSRACDDDGPADMYAKEAAQLRAALAAAQP
jgi:hypothetical protein